MADFGLPGHLAFAYPAPDRRKFRLRCGAVAIGIDGAECLFRQNGQFGGGQPAVAVGIGREQRDEPIVPCLLARGRGGFGQGNDAIAVDVILLEMMLDAAIARGLIVGRAGIGARAHPDFVAGDPEVAVEVHRQDSLDRPGALNRRAPCHGEVDVALVEAVAGPIRLAKLADHPRDIVFDMAAAVESVHEGDRNVGDCGLCGSGCRDRQRGRRGDPGGHAPMCSLHHDLLARSSVTLKGQG
ncbi:MAG: hypothetical protein A2885_21695 [Sphingopyxis sp. RIFCSPHIGHO2_01_FULL_65_24]|nr:MAG: hypothetical protein A2885_21695 [Sphingopyxis sp. RIFCSPHIGHO2_01_FULL_65_24]